MPDFASLFSLKQISSVTLTLFAIIDILGSIPIIIQIRQREGRVNAEAATLVAAIIMVVFLFLGQSILALFSVDLASFALAGSLIIFFIALEMVLGVEIFRHNALATGTGSIVPLAFPIIVGAGTMTTLLSLRALYSLPNVLVGIFANLVFVYLVLKSSRWIEQKLGKAGEDILRRVFGVILLAIAIKLFKQNF
jgi:multiple antibiotic resistance protein